MRCVGVGIHSGVHLQGGKTITVSCWKGASTEGVTVGKKVNGTVALIVYTSPSIDRPLAWSLGLSLAAVFASR